MIHRLFQTGCEQLQNDVLSNFCSKIYKVGHFPEAHKSVPGASESGRYSVGKPFTFSGKKITHILWMAFCNAATVTNLKTRELLQLLTQLHLCLVVLMDGLAQLSQSRALLWAISISLSHLLGQMGLVMSWTYPELVMFLTALASSTTSAVFLLLAEVVFCVTGVKSADLSMVCVILCKLESLESKMLGMSFLSVKLSGRKHC